MIQDPDKGSLTANSRSTSSLILKLVVTGEEIKSVKIIVWEIRTLRIYNRANWISSDSG